MANGLKSKEPKINCIIILCDPTNVIEVKRKLNFLRVQFIANNKYILKMHYVGIVREEGHLKGAMNKASKNSGSQ